MLILGLDTATPVTTVALATEEQVLADMAVTGERTQAERLIPLIADAFDRAGVGVRDLDGIAVGIGPGLFTSLRIGVVTARMLAQVLDVPLVSASSLEILAESLAYSTRLVVSVIDARRGEVFAAFYRAVEGELTEVSPPRVLKPEALGAELAALDAPAMLVGDGVWAYREVLMERLAGRVEVASAAYSHPRAANLVSLAFPRFVSGAVEDLNRVVPIYIRPADAEIAYDRRGRA